MRPPFLDDDKSSSTSSSSSRSSTSTTHEADEDLPEAATATVNIYMSIQKMYPSVVERKPSYLRDCLQLSRNVASKLDISVSVLFDLLEVRLSRHSAKPKSANAGTTCPKTDLRDKYFVRLESPSYIVVLRNKSNRGPDLPTDIDQRMSRIIHQAVEHMIDNQPNFFTRNLPKKADTIVKRIFKRMKCP